MGWSVFIVRRLRPRDTTNHQGQFRWLKNSTKEIKKGVTSSRKVSARYVDLVDAAGTSVGSTRQQMSVTRVGHIPLSFDNRLAVHIAVLGSMESNTADNRYLGGGLWGIGVSWTSVSRSARGRLDKKRRTRKFDEFAPVLCYSKLDTVNDNFIGRN